MLWLSTQVKLKIFAGYKLNLFGYKYSRIGITRTLRIGNNPKHSGDYKHYPVLVDSDRLETYAYLKQLLTALPYAESVKDVEALIMLNIKILDSNK